MAGAVVSSKKEKNAKDLHLVMRKLTARDFIFK